MTLLNDTGEQAVLPSGDVVPYRTSPLEYLREAVRIARFDDEAMQRVSRDSKALKYAACVFGLPWITMLIVTSLLSTRPAGEPEVSWVDVLILAPVILLVQLCCSAITVAVLHYLAKLVFGATGSYLGLLRVMWLGSVVLWLAVIPVIGVFVGAIWYLLISLVTFENVDRIERLQALSLMAVFTVVSILIQTAFRLPGQSL